MTTMPLPSPRSVSRLSFVIVALLAASTGCATGGGGGSGGNPDRLTVVQIDEVRSQYRDAYELVTRMRPQWLRARTAMPGGPAGGELPVVYLDGTRLGPVAELQRISMNQVATLQYMNASDATTRYGTGHAGGAILVVSRR